MTTTQELIARARRQPTVGMLPSTMQIGQVVFDSALPDTGLGYVRRMTHRGYTVEIEVVVVAEDGSDADEEITWHSTLPLSALPGMTAGTGSGFWADLNHGGNLRATYGEATLADALDFVILGA